MNCIFCKHIESDSGFFLPTQNMEYNGYFRCSSCRQDHSICKKCLFLHIKNETYPLNREYLLCPICERTEKINSIIE